MLIRSILVLILGISLSGCLSSDEVQTQDEVSTSNSAAATSTSEGPTTTTAQAVAATTTHAASTTSLSLELPAYEILQVEDVSFGNTVRYVIHVWVDGTPDVETLTELAVLIEEEFRAETPYNALSVGFYDYPEFVGYGFVLGRVESAPFGEWGRADEVELGDYSTFERASHLREKDWTQQPSQLEVTIWERWEEVINELDPELTRDDVRALEVEGHQVVAQEMGLEAQEVEQAVERAAFWPFSGK